MHRSSHFARGAFAAVALLLARCSSSTPLATPDVPSVDGALPDAAAPVDGATTDDATADVGGDRGRPMREPQPIYGQCVSDAECEAGLTCRTETETGIPGGQCNRECTRDDDCVLGGIAPADGYCTPATAANPRRLCQRVCVNGIDCERTGFTCQLINQTLQLRVCIPVCTAESCIDGNTCSASTNRCLRPGVTPAGVAFGAACRGATDPMISDANRCPSGLCQAEYNYDSNMRAVPSGWIGGGMCLSRCILPQGYNSSTFWPERSLPRAGCPEGAICFPNGSLNRGDLGLCLDECAANSDCRPGYTCRRTFQLTATRSTTFDNGYCIPVNCAAAGVTCPAGHTCRMSTATAGICVSNTAPM